MKKQKDVELSIVIPTYNEIKRVPKTIKEYMSFFDKKKINYEIIVADISNDGSKELILKMRKKHKNLHLLNIRKRGKGLAVYEAFKVSKGRYLSFTDADNATVPTEFYKLFKYIDRYNAVIGSRGLSGSNVVCYNQTLFRKLGSFVLSVVFVRILFGLKMRDTQCGAKIFRRGKIMRILPKMKITNSFFDIELLWRFKKIGTIKEVPVTWVDNKFSNFKWKDTVKGAISLLRLRFGCEK